MNQLSNEIECQFEEVAAYLDGELSDAVLEKFEAHLKECARCVAELRTQRQLLCTLDAAFSETRSFQLPQNFTRVIAVHAECDLGGMRQKKERRRAIQLCAILALLSFALLGAASGALVFQPARSFLRIALSILDVAWRTIYDAGTGIAVIVRMLGRAVVLSPYGFGVSLALAFLVVIVISLLPRLIANYHRAQVIE